MDDFLKVSGGALWFLAGTAVFYGEEGVYTVFGFAGFLVVYCLLGALTALAIYMPIKAVAWLLEKAFTPIERMFWRWRARKA